MKDYYILNQTGLNEKLKEYKVEIDYCSCCCQNKLLKIYLQEQQYQKLILDGFRPKIINNLTKNSIRYEDYHGEDKLKQKLTKLSKQNTSLCKLNIIGRTVNNNTIYHVSLSNETNKNNKVRVLIVGNIHGDELIGRELSILMIEDWIDAYLKGDTLIVELLDNIHLDIIPSLNPDGFENVDQSGNWSPVRFNANGIDLNRNFPSLSQRLKEANLSLENETKALIDWSKNKKFNLCLSIHSGAVLVNYPYDKGTSGIENPTPDGYDSFFKYLSHLFTSKSDFFKLSHFPNGVTNGSKWYSINGSSGDWRFDFKREPELTLELGKKKLASKEEIKDIWNQTEISFLNLFFSLLKS